MRIRIKKFSITNYRSCVNTSVEPHPDLSALIGKNASGKSSILNGILLLKSLFNQPGRPIRPDRTSARSRINAELSCDNKIILLRADVLYSATETSRDEVFGGNISWNFRNLSGVDEWITFPLGFDLDMYRHLPTRFGMQSSKLFISRQIEFRFNAPKKLKKQLRYFATFAQPLHEFFGSISYYSASQFTDPTRCPVSIEIEDERIQRRALRQGEHTRFLYDLYKIWKAGSRDYQEFLSIVGPQGLKLVDRIYFRELELPQSRYEVRVGGKVVRGKSQRQPRIRYLQL